MPLSISNTLSPFSVQNATQKPAFNTGVTTPSSLAKKSVPGVVAPPAVSTPAVSPAPQTQPVQTSSAPVKGLLTPGTASLAPVSTLPPPQPQTTFSGLVGGIANASQPNAQAQKYTQQTADYGKNSYDIGQQAQDIAKQFGQRYADVGGKGARFEAGQLTTGTTPVAEGNAAVTAQTTAAQQAALAQGEQAALQGLGYELTGANQAASAANQAAGQAYTGQGQQITGLNAAAGLAQPNLGSIGQVPYSPLDLSQGSPLGAPGGSAADAARVAGSFQGAQAAAAAPGQTQANIYGTQVGQQAAYQSAHQQAGALTSQLNDLISSFGLNPSDLSAVNAGIQTIAKNTSDPRYKILNNYLADVASRYSQILTPPGGSSTDTTRAVAAGMLDNLASGNSIQTVLQSLDQQAQAVVANVVTPQAGGNTSSTGNGPGSIQVPASDGKTYGFYQDASGQWHAS